MIGIFDSGVGGLSVFREIYKLLPDQEYVFYADSANCPYGDKSAAQIQERCSEITEFLLKKGAQIIVVACNTATAAAISYLREKYSSVKFIGMEPAVKPAALGTKSGVIGVLATAGTLKGSKYLKTKGEWEDNVKIVEHVGRGFVELVESGELTGPKAEEVVKASLQPLLDEGADTIVLGCTHYPFLRQTISKIAGEGVKVIDPAGAVARHLIYVMVQERLLSEVEATEALARIAGENLMPAAKPKVELISSGDGTVLEKTFENLI
ncbi:MAG: glutamate racemase [Bacteroidales bacterium]|nr:glutamate racemase [Bacteroidales bacterium]